MQYKYKRNSPVKLKLNTNAISQSKLNLNTKEIAESREIRKYSLSEVEVFQKNSFRKREQNKVPKKNVNKLKSYGKVIVEL